MRRRSGGELRRSLASGLPRWLLADMKPATIAGIATRKIYWLLVAGIPLMPPYVLLRYHSSLACSDNGICFRYGYPFLNGEGSAIVLSSLALLWPMCAWRLIGEHVFAVRSRSGSSRKARASRSIMVFGRLYWLLVAAIPVSFWYLFGTFQAPVECLGNGNCIEFYLPLDGVSRAAVSISGCLVWPLCLLKLVGHPRKKIRGRAE